MLEAERILATVNTLLDAGERTDFLDSITARRSSGVRLHVDESQEGLPFDVSPVAWHNRGYLVAGDVRPGCFLGFATGDYYVQDPASLLAVRLIEPRRDELVCDLCAAPGGKATALLETIQDGWLLVNETVQSRLPPLQLNLARHGSTRYVLSRLDPSQLAERIGPLFDAVLVDAPCSGQSLVARGKQRLTAFDPRAIEHCAARQLRIIEAAADLVRPGGRMVYSTCTFSIAENEALIQAFLESRPGWLVEPHSLLKRWESPILAGSYRLWPHRDEGGGAFATCLRKDQDTTTDSKSASRALSNFKETTLPDEFATWATCPGSADVAATSFPRIFQPPLRPMENGSQIFLWPETIPDELAAVACGGPEIAFRKGSTWFPAYASARFRDAIVQPVRTEQLSEQQAVTYVQGEVVPCRERGWCTATYRGKPLGWLKGDGKRGKNHLPKPARLRTVKSG